MAHTVAKLGDRIVITKLSLEDDYGREFIVTEPIESEYVWVRSETIDGSFRFYHTSYRIVSRKSVLDMSREEMKLNLEYCSDCHDTGLITLFRSVVKCQCRIGE